MEFGPPLDCLTSSDHAVGQRLRRALEGKGVFHRFKSEPYQRHPELISSWHALPTAGPLIRAAQCLADAGLIEEVATEQFVQNHPEPALP